MFHVKQLTPDFWNHSCEAREELPEAMLALATLLNIRVIIDRYKVSPRFFTILFIRRAITPSDIVAYVHCEARFEWLPNEAAWLELFTQLWPGV